MQDAAWVVGRGLLGGISARKQTGPSIEMLGPAFGVIDGI